MNLSNKQNALFINSNSSNTGQNQMFKNDIISNLTGGKFNMKNQAAEYNTTTTGNNALANVRSIERLNKIEEEIQKDYSKYVNEYGLSKTAFAKAVNSLRERQQTNN